MLEVYLHPRQERFHTKSRGAVFFPTRWNSFITSGTTVACSRETGNADSDDSNEENHRSRAFRGVREGPGPASYPGVVSKQPGPGQGAGLPEDTVKRRWRRYVPAKAKPDRFVEPDYFRPGAVTLQLLGPSLARLAIGPATAASAGATGTVLARSAACASSTGPVRRPSSTTVAPCPSSIATPARP